MRHNLTGLLTAATIGLSTLALTGTVSAAPFSQAAPALAERAGTSALIDQVQFAGPGQRRARVGGPGVVRPGVRPNVVYRGGNRGYNRRGVATAIGIGAAAAVVGGIIASQQRPVYEPEPVYVERRRYYEEPEPVYVQERPVYADQGSVSCARRYRSYNPSTGTYVGFDGVERFCP
jgi:BA14K-like protein